MKNNYVLAGSASCFDLYELRAQLEQIHDAPVDVIHYDIVDGRFNQCLILGLPTLQNMRPHTQLPIEVHMAVYEPERYLKQFIDSGADLVSVHPEGMKGVMEGKYDMLHAFGEVKDVFAQIRSLGAEPALAFRSETLLDQAMVDTLSPEERRDVLDVLEEAAYIVKLTVNPGFAGQQIQPAAFAKMKALRDLLDANGIETKIAADGNVHAGTIPTLVEHGAGMFIGGTSGLFLRGKTVRECAQVMLAAAGL